MLVRKPHALTLVVALVAIVAAGCGGVGQSAKNASPTPSPVPSPTPSPTPTSAGLSVTPNSLNFGNLAVNGSSSQTLKVTNNGAAAITITQESVTGSAFSTGLTTPMNLNAGQSTNVSVVFSPHAAG